MTPATMPAPAREPEHAPQNAEAENGENDNQHDVTDTHDFSPCEVRLRFGGANGLYWTALSK